MTGFQRYCLFLILINCDATVFGKNVLTDITSGTGPTTIFKIIPKVKNENDSVYVRGSIIVLKSFGNDNAYTAGAFKQSGKSNGEKQLMSMKGKGACSAMSQYIGSIFIEVERLAGVPNPGECPIPPGNYTLKNWYAVDLNAIPLFKMVPKAMYRVAIRLTTSNIKTELGSIAFKFEKS